MRRPAGGHPAETGHGDTSEVDEPDEELLAKEEEPKNQPQQLGEDVMVGHSRMEQQKKKPPQFSAQRALFNPDDFEK